MSKWMLLALSEPLRGRPRRFLPVALDDLMAINGTDKKWEKQRLLTFMVH
jgi:hypothetical protein